MTAPFRRIYDEPSAVGIIENAETDLILKLQKQSGLLSFSIFKPPIAIKEEDVPKTTKKLE